MLYAGVMLTAQGPKLFEYNVRFGDPECQVLMLRMMSDIVPAFLASCDGELKHFDLRWFPEPALTVVMAAKGYPGDYKKGTRIEGLDDAAKIEGVEIFHAGTVAKDGAILANGGRVLNVCAIGQDRAARRSSAPIRRSTASNGRMVSAAATSPGRRWSRSGRQSALNRHCETSAATRRSDPELDCFASLADCQPQLSCELSKHAADGLRHLGCRKGPQQFGANIAERSEAQRQRHEG